MFVSIVSGGKLQSTQDFTQSMRQRVWWRAAVLVATLLPSCLCWAVESQVRFNRDVRPILSENCFPCHGADASRRKAKLRLDTPEGAAKPGVLSAGKPDESELVKRIFSTDPEQHMPPPDSNRHLTPAQQEMLRAWVAQGAKYETHWAFQAATRPPVPAVKEKKWPRNPIDNFILARLESERLEPTPAAPTAQLLRRLSFDLGGLPPTPAQIAKWLGSRDPLNAAVDELLASPHFGERMAVDWMDVARYADTHGFNNDSMRSMWRWRDWVINAFNRNTPYNRFITEQLAGDLLSKPTLDQVIATGFNRNHVINSEGGIIDEEYRVEYVADRVRTTSLAWMGLTMECARCHDHKFDPITQRDYYRFFAFFNNVDECGEDGRIANASPMVASPTEAQQREMDRHRMAISAADKGIADAIAARNWSEVRLEDVMETTDPKSAAPTNSLIALEFRRENIFGQSVSNLAANSKPFVANSAVVTNAGPAGHVAAWFDGSNALKSEALPKVDFGKGWAFSAWVRRDAAVVAPLFSTASFSVPESSQSYGHGIEIRLTTNGNVEARIAGRWPAYSVAIVTREAIGTGEWRHVLFTCDGSTAAKGLRLFIDGDECSRDVLHDDVNGGVALAGPAKIGGSDDKGSPRLKGAMAAVRLLAGPINPELHATLAANEALRLAVETPAAERSRHQVQMARTAWLARFDTNVATMVASRSTAQKSLLAAERHAPTTMVMRELPQRRATFVLSRGQYDRPREQVEPGVPEFLLPFPADAPKNRLGLAKWLTDPRNPLTARVVVNRLWQSIFGEGLVKTSENLGFQGDWPSHPELLDWLAVDFVENGWDVKRLLKLIVTSATYRQDSLATPTVMERDPENRLLARGPRQRLSAEMIRDQALAVSGLLYDEIGGPPVYPYQPTNLYKGIVVAADYPGTKYIEGKGRDLYRRSVYTFWKRTVPHPTLTTFDTPDREVCVARRLKTNTPLQALALMNDRIQLEAAAGMAQRMMTEGGATPADRVSFAFYLATARKPDGMEQKQLAAFLNKRLEFYRAHPDGAKAFVAASARAKGEADPVELAAYANVAGLILNLDETISNN